MVRRTVVVSLALVVCLSVPAVAQPAAPPVPRLVNWSAPSSWTPPVAKREATGERTVSAESVPTAPLPFVAIAPCRLLDTRTGSGFTGAFGPPQLVGLTSRTIPVPSSTTCTGIPANVGAYSLNFTVVAPAGGGAGYWLKAWPTGQAQPQYLSVINFGGGSIVGNMAVVAAGTSGAIDIEPQVATDLVIDMNGYYAPSATVTGSVMPNPMQIAMLQWYPAANIPAHFTAGGDISDPWALVFDGAHIWVANAGSNSVTELNASDGSKVGTFTAGGDIYGPLALAFDGAHIWVSNYLGNSVTELNASDGSKVGTFNAAGDINFPYALAFDGAHIWVANLYGNSVTELNASNGSKVGTFAAGGDINTPTALAFDRAHIWVANYGGVSVTELNASNGSKVGTFTAGGDINVPYALVFDGAHIWVANGGNSVTELNASDGSKVGTFTAGGDINSPQAIAFDGAHIWVANWSGNSVTELNASDGSKVGTFTASGDIHEPTALAFDGAHIWVANYIGNSLDKL